MLELMAAAQITTTQQATLWPPDARQPDTFGDRVAISGDTAVVGRQDCCDGNLEEVAYVFVRNGTTWSQQAVLRASNAEAEDAFGGSVAISGDTIVVGASAEDSDATGVNGDQNNNRALTAGAAYIFVRDGTNWSQQAYLPGFGVNLALSGDTLLVGSWGDDAVYVFTGLEPPPPPQLAIEHTANNVRLSWPLSASGFVLDETSALESPPTATVWSEIPAPYESDGTVNFATLPLAAENKFYRLRKP
jgi:hypothetical protein